MIPIECYASVQNIIGTLFWYKKLPMGVTVYLPLQVKLFVKNIFSLITIYILLLCFVF